ncbi:unnamed protein product [Paramecium sonneborni]|uniref:Uncharacterized protein n=1 Tax=Paramecium sonneborni TaxID=65129 RepID=A0A8S1KTY5_9CILI|nr:unnamed protein product [Paramecium sonneborni]
MSTQNLSLLEDQLLLSKDETIGKLIKGADQYYYYFFLKIFNEHGYQLTSEQKQQLLANKNMQTQLSQKTNLRALFLEYDYLSSQTPSQEIQQRQKDIVDQINQKYLKFTFNHAAPFIARGCNQTAQSVGLNQQMTAGISKLDETIFEISKGLKNAYTEVGFASLKPKLYGSLDIDKIATSSQNVIKKYLQNVGNEIIDFPGIPEFYNQLYCFQDFKNNFSQDHFRKLSLQQMEELLQLNKYFLENQEFVGEYYLKKLQYDLKNIQYSKLTEDEKKQILQNIKNVQNTLPSKFKSFNDQILYELLQIGIEFNIYDFDLFLDFLKDPKQNYNSVNQKYLTFIGNNRRKYQQCWHEYHKFNTRRWMDIDQLIEKYLIKYLEKNDELAILEQYMETKYLKKIQARVKNYKIFILSNQEIEEMNLSKLLTICSFNQMYFKHGDLVKLYVELKNIPKLNIKIFELNSENYYLQKQQQLDTSINLDIQLHLKKLILLTPIHRFKKLLKNLNFKLQQTFKEVYLQAFIKKGRLQLRETMTSAGHRFQIFNENFELCAGEKTGIWIDKKFYNMDQQRKEILIPFGQKDQQYNAVIVHDNFAEFTTVFLQQEQYQLKCAFLVAGESLLQKGQNILNEKSIRNFD